MKTAVQYQVSQERFQGPLDLLLDLIEREKLPINEISLAKVTDEYVTHVKSMEIVDQEALAEFLVVAAQLMLIKSRSLLPHLALSGEEEESIDDLERRLAEYKRIKELAKELRTIENAGLHIFSREAYLGMPAVFYPQPKITGGRLAEVCEGALKAIPKFQKLIEEKLQRVVSLEEKIRDIQSRLALRLNHIFSELVEDSREKVEVIVSFLAILELAKQKLVRLDQDDPFGAIRVHRQ